MPTAPTAPTTDMPMRPNENAPLPTNTVSLPGNGPSDLAGEWLLTNGLGGFAMGTAPGINTRRYHALLVAALTPPVNRVLALSAVADTITLDPGTLRPDTGQEHAVALTPFRFAGARSKPVTAPTPCVFTRGVECTWVYTIPTPAGDATVTKTLHLFDKRNAVALTYRVDAPGGFRLVVRPLTALRDFHQLCSGEEITTQHQARPVERGVMCATRDAGIHLTSDEADYKHDPDIWHDLEYERDAQRGQACVEDLFSPGEFVLQGTGSLSATIHASVDAMEPDRVAWDRDARTQRVAARIAGALQKTPNASAEDTDALARLVAAAEDFVVQRGPASNTGVSIIAGYPWFSDWGRDTMIALPGLLLCTGRHDDALHTLRVFADNRQRGLIPNRFDDRAGPAHYNTVDASLWFLHAAAEYRRVTGEHDAYMAHLAPACNDVIDAYRVGTDFGIRMDSDGLITAGSPETQLTWMDAQRAGVTFTPRYGKAVEINALWHHGLVVTAEAIEGDFPRRATEQRSLADLARESFNDAFVRPDGLGLFDRLEPVGEGGWSASTEIRPNQLFAASLEHGPINQALRGTVVGVVTDRLVTPAGVRTLDPADDAYIGRYAGDMFARDRAYHNGTVWPWLIGPYAEAVLRAGGFDAASRAGARASIDHLIATLRGDVVGHGLGQLSEIYDGDAAPDEARLPDGCPAQAWSVAEPLRVLMMLMRST